VSSLNIRVEVKLADGRIVKDALARPQGQAKGSILLVHEWWGSFRSDDAGRICGVPMAWRTLV